MDHTRQVPINAERATELVRIGCEEHGLEFRDVFTPAQVAELAQALHYVCTPGTVAEFVRKRYFSAADPRELTATEVFCLIGALESRRRWKQAPSRHDAKKSGARLLIEQCQAAGAPSPIADIDNYTTEDLLVRLVQCHHAATREGLYEAVRLKLEGFEE